ncbi:hypothetical protein EUX98_g8727 [Antrodiella citrinella]|uniref:HECT-type E3 ubiquitin transferase n=1 Tax=Antrodiella citrinella TaxID=2447956 RepID=A0A4S4M5B5_9APHY|nr:hypothetical protein EUX98_g8727 [Antrodiella citrinella]
MDTSNPPNPGFNNSAHRVTTPSAIAHFMSTALRRTDDVEQPLASTEEAQVVLDEMWKVLDSPVLPTAHTGGSPFFVYRNSLRKLCLKVAIRHDILPTALILKEVHVIEGIECGGGGFADVYCGTFRGEKVALKRLRIYLMSSQIQKQEIKKAFCRESILWKNLVHDHILPFLGVAEDAFKGAICMVLPWQERGSLRHYLEAQKQVEEMSDEQIALAVDRWLYQTGLGLEYLHEEGIVHGDLHAGNILVDDVGNARLTDFGMALIAEANEYNYGSIHGGGATRWQAPELIDPEEFGLTSRRPTKQSDMFSFACTAIELYTGKPPFPDITNHKVSVRYVSGDRPPRPSLPAGTFMSDAVWTLMDSCWAHRILARPPVQQVVVELAAVTAGVSNSERLAASLSAIRITARASEPSVTQSLPRVRHEIPPLSRSTTHPAVLASAEMFDSRTLSWEPEHYHSIATNPISQISPAARPGVAAVKNGTTASNIDLLADREGQFSDANGMACGDHESTASQSRPGASLGPLAERWEMRHDRTGRTYFVDHKLKISFWDDPRLLAEEGSTPEYHRDFRQKLFYLRNLSALRPRAGDCHVEVRREFIFEDSYREIMKWKPDDLQRRLMIKFNGEDSLDYGSLSRELFFLLSQAIPNPAYSLLQYSTPNRQDTLRINPTSGVDTEQLNRFRFIGHCVGLGIFHHRFLNVRFVDPSYKMILKKNVNLVDLESVDHGAYRKLSWLLNNDVTDILDETFSVTEEHLGKQVTLDLKPGGRHVELTEDNKQEYIDLVVEYYVCKRIQPQFDAFMSGLNDLIPQALIEVFNEADLGLLIEGIIELDVCVF